MGHPSEDRSGAASPPPSAGDRWPLDGPPRAAADSPGGSSRRATWTPLVGLKGSGDWPPLFCIHPIGGDIRCYDQLIRHLPSRLPVYALRARGTDGRHPPHRTLEEMAEAYLAGIRRAQPTGPYHLAGWSTGGSYAYHLAWRLHQQGESVDLLAFFDVPPPSICAQADLDDHARFLCDIVELANRFTGARMQADYHALRPLDPETQFQTVLREAKRHLVVAPTTSTDRIRCLLDTARSHVEMLQRYDPPAFAQPIELFRPRQPGLLEQRMGPDLQPDLGWSRITRGPVVLHTVEGDHFSMMTGPNVSRIAEILGDWLRDHVAGNAPKGYTRPT